MSKDRAAPRPHTHRRAGRWGKPLVSALLAATLAGCVYRMNIQQGNFLDPQAIDQLRTGMTRSQVRYLLGTPMVPTTFDESRWDYLYYIKKGRLRAPEERRLVVYFEDDKITRVEREGQALTLKAEKPAAPARALPSATSPSEPAATQPNNSTQTQPGLPQTPAPESKS